MFNTWRQHERALVRFRSDPVLQHERVVMAWVAKDVYLILTPDRDLTHQRLACTPLREIVRVSGDSYAELGEEDAMYLMAAGPLGDYTRQEGLALLAETTAAVHGARSARGFPDLRSGCYLVVTAAADFPIGTPLTLEAGDCESPPKAMVCRAGLPLFAEYVATADKDEWVLKHRVMDILYDMSSGERHRTMEQVSGDAVAVDFDDWPLDGTRVGSWIIRALRRQNQTFLQHHGAWVAKSGIRDGDRVTHEHATICRALHYFCTYDQVRVPNLAGAETLIKRLVLIEEAYRGRPSAPSYEGAEFFMGVRDTADGSLVNPALCKHTAARMKEEAEIHKERRKAAEENDLRRHI
jgi:hypothetical protein